MNNLPIPIVNVVVSIRRQGSDKRKKELLTERKYTRHHPLSGQKEYCLQRSKLYPCIERAMSLNRTLIHLLVLVD